MKKTSRPWTNEEGEVRELTLEDMRSMRPAAEVLPPELLAMLPKRHVGQRGTQKTPVKKPVTIRYSTEVIDYFKATGEGWQARIDNILKNWIRKHPHAA